MIIAIDGPAGSGKTTIAKLLAKALNISYLDTGATYRALTVKALERGVDLSNQEAIAALAREVDIQLDGSKVYLDGKDVTAQIRKPEVDRAIPQIASNPLARGEMVKLQRRVTAGRDFVVEGRDITTVVFPQAPYKFYLDANPKERAKRRWKELEAKDVRIDLACVQEAMKKRDQADLTRTHSPLKKSEEAVYIDTTELSIEEVLCAIKGHIEQ